MSNHCQFDLSDGYAADEIGIYLAMDLTEIKRVEEALRQLNARREKRVQDGTAEVNGGNRSVLQDPQQLLKTALASLRGAVFILDAKMVIIDCNPAASEIFGYSRDEMLGQTTAFLHVDESGLEEFRTHLSTAMKVEGYLNLPEFRMKRKNGEVFFTEHTVMPLEDDRGICMGWVSVVRDITKQKQMTDALRENEQRFRQLAESIEVVFWMESPDGGQIHYVSPAFEKIWGSSIEDLMRDRNLWVRAIHPDDSPRVLRWLERHNRGKAFDVQEFRIIRPDGEVRWVSDCAFPVRNEKGEIYRVAGFAEDITKRKEAEEALKERTLELEKVTETLEERVKERTAELENANKRLQELSSRLLSTQEEERKRIAGELHDTIGSCLNAVKFEIEHFMQRIGKDSNGTEESLNSVLPVIEEGIEECRRIQQDLRPSMLDDLGLLATLSWFCRRYQAIYTGTKVELEQTLEEREIPNSLKVVIFRVTQEGMNNIAKHSKADLVHVSLRKMDGRIELVIKDNGHGCDLEKVVGSKSMNRGLGLTSMMERTELSGGSFAIESEEGKGTTVRASWRLNGEAGLQLNP